MCAPQSNGLPVDAAAPGRGETGSWETRTSSWGRLTIVLFYLIKLIKDRNVMYHYVGGMSRFCLSLDAIHMYRPTYACITRERDPPGVSGLQNPTTFLLCFTFQPALPTSTICLKAACGETDGKGDKLGDKLRLDK